MFQFHKPIYSVKLDTHHIINISLRTTTYVPHVHIENLNLLKTQGKLTHRNRTFKIAKFKSQISQQFS